MVPLLLAAGATASASATRATSCDVVEHCRCDHRGSNTSAVQTACLQHCITTCHSAGGGATIVFPPGTFHTGSLSLPSHTTLQLAAGATILGSIDPRDYPLVPALPSYGVSRDCCCNDWLKYNCTGGGGALRHMSLLSSTHADDITIIGAGPNSIIDGTLSPTPTPPHPQLRSTAGRQWLALVVPLRERRSGCRPPPPRPAHVHNQLPHRVPVAEGLVSTHTASSAKLCSLG